MAGQKPHGAAPASLPTSLHMWVLPALPSSCPPPLHQGWVLEGGGLDGQGLGPKKPGGRGLGCRCKIEKWTWQETEAGWPHFIEAVSTHHSPAQRARAGQEGAVQGPT